MQLGPVPNHAKIGKLKTDKNSFFSTLFKQFNFLTSVARNYSLEVHLYDILAFSIARILTNNLCYKFLLGSPLTVDIGFIGGKCKMFEF